MKKNAIILAAGKSNRFAPFTYERPKGLFRVRGEILIERQINQLREAGVEEIFVVIGYMKEKFFYLEKKYNVKFIINNDFSTKGNLYSLYLCREWLADSFICCADHYFVKNFFLVENESNISYRSCAYQQGKFREFAIDYSDANVITGFKVGGEDHMAMVGYAYFNNTFSKLFRILMDNEINDFGVSSMFWEEFYARHQKELTLYMKEFRSSDILEFDSIEDLLQFDSEFLINVDSEIIINICKVLSCRPNSIVNIQVIQAGLTNVSFGFSVNNTRYVYRHPGGTSGNLIDRKSEVFAQMKAKELEVDKSVIYIDETGWKLSYFVENTIECDFEKNSGQLEKAMKYLKIMHSITMPNQREGAAKRFNTVQEGKKLMRIASASKGNLFSEFKELIEKIEKLDAYVEEDRIKMCMPLVLCHNDVYAPNYLITDTGDMYLIDWEYAGFNDPANDVACILSRYDFNDNQIEKYFRAYFGRNLTDEEHRHFWAYISLCGFYWFCWGLYKGSVGDDDGFFFLPAYRNCIRYIDIALESYER